MANNRFSSWKEDNLLKGALQTYVKQGLQCEEAINFFCGKTFLDTPGVSIHLSVKFGWADGLDGVWGKKSKAPWASSWMNSWLLPLWKKESLCKTICMKMHVTCTFILLKIKSFSCKMFCTSIHSKKEANSNSKVCIWAKWPIRSALIPVSVACSN